MIHFATKPLRSRQGPAVSAVACIRAALFRILRNRVIFLPDRRGTVRSHEMRDAKRGPPVPTFSYDSRSAQSTGLKDYRSRILACGLPFRKNASSSSSRPLLV